MTRTKEESSKLRHEAKMLALRMAGIDEGESNGWIERLIDCIISAAVLEVMAVMEEAMKVKP